MVHNGTGRTRKAALSISFGWEDEHGLWQWELTLAPRGSVSVLIREFPEEPGRGKTILRTVVSCRTFGRAALEAAARVLTAQGVAGYKRTWAEQEFPLGSLLLLDEALRSRRPRRMFDVDDVVRSRIPAETKAITRITRPHRSKLG